MKELRNIDVLSIGIVAGPDGRLMAETVVRDRDDGAVYVIPGGELTAVERPELPDTATARDLLTDPTEDDA